MRQFYSNQRKIVNDPVHGFVTIPGDFLFQIIENPLSQRLRRIKQLGLTSLVYPGALHTRFHHALGAMHLMMEAIDILRMKGSVITEEEAEATLAAILLHDVGHGPFSHSLEHTLIPDVSHEELSERIMQQLNQEYNGKLDLAIAIFKNRYPKRFLHQLVSSQLDMDRLDYLKRDSFYTGVSEGVISTDRLIKMLVVVNDELMIEAKGIYSIEKFIVARRLMYWQVYYHKTVISAENMLINILKRAKEIAASDDSLFATPALKYFLTLRLSKTDFLSKPEVLRQFCLLDDYDVFTSIKQWVTHPDKVISVLANGLVNRKLFRTELRNQPPTEEEINRFRSNIGAYFNLHESRQIDCLFTSKPITNNAYNPGSDKISILFKDGSTADIAECSDQLNVSILTRDVTKYFLCYPKHL